MLTEDEVKAIYQEVWGREREPDANEIAEGMQMSREALYADLARRTEDLAPTETQTDPSVSDAIYRMINRDKESWRQALQEAAAEAGVDYHESDLEGMIRKVRRQGNEGVDPQVWIDEAAANYEERSENVPGQDDPGGDGGGDGGGGDGGGDGGGGGGGGDGGTDIGVGTAAGGGTGGGGTSLADRYTSPIEANALQSTGRPTSLMGDFPWSAPRTPPIVPYGYPGYGLAPPYGAPPPYHAGTYTPPVYQPGAPFIGPTPEQMAADPGYQFRLTQGQEALERSGAARGVTNTGGTLKDIVDYGQQAASQEYGNVYNRMAGTYGMNEAARQGAFDRNALQGYQAWSGNELGRARAYDVNEANRAAAYGTNEATRRNWYDVNAAQNLLGYQTNANMRQQEYLNQYNNWVQSYNQWRGQGADRFNEQYMLAMG